MNSRKEVLTPNKFGPNRAPQVPAVQRRPPLMSTPKASAVSIKQGANPCGIAQTRSINAKSQSYAVHAPIPLPGRGQEIRATIIGTPQIAGSIEISPGGAGNVYISNLKVDQQHRRRGVAAKLIDAAISNARRQGFKAASLEARPSDNGISQQALEAMYRRQGFKSVGKSSRGSPMMERRLR